MTVLAVALVLINSAICLYLFLMKSKIGSPFQFFYLSLFGIVVFPSIFDINYGVYQFHPFASPINLSADLIFSAHIRILPMLVAMLVFEKSLASKKNDALIELSKIRFGANFYDIIIAILVIFLISGIYYYGFSVLSTTSLETLRSGNVSKFSLIIFYLEIALVGIPAIYVLRASRVATGSIVFAIFCATYLLLGGSRQIVFISIAVAIAMILPSLGKWRYAILILMFTIGIPFADTLLQILKMLRNLPSTDARLAFLESLVMGNISLEYFRSGAVGSEGTVRYVMYGFLASQPPPEFGHLSYFGRTMLFWLPSALDFASIKPGDFETTMFAFVMGNRVGTMHATFFGSIYADALNWFVVWILFFVVVFRLLEQLMVKMRALERSMVWSSCVYLSFMVSRGSLYAPVVVTAIVLTMAALSQFFRGVSGRPVPQTASHHYYDAQIGHRIP